MVDELPPLVVSYSEINAYMRCPLMWALEWRDRWRKPVQPGGALDMGTAAHEVMAIHYGSLMKDQSSPVQFDTPTRLSIAYECVDAFMEGHPLEDYLRGMYSRYVALWGADEDWEILGVEHAGDFHLGWVTVPSGSSFGLGRVKREVRMKWIADLIVRSKSLGGVLVYDHKTCSQLRDDKSLEWDIQLPDYIVGAMLSHPEWNIIGGAHNEIRKPTKGVWPAKTTVPWGRRTRAPWDLKALKEITDNFLATVQEMVNAPERPRNSPSTMTGGCDWCSVSEVHDLMRRDPKIKPARLLAMEGFEQDEEKMQY